MLRAQWDAVCGVLSAPVPPNQPGSGPQGEQSPFSCCLHRPEEQKPLEEGCLKISSSTASTHRWVPFGALLGLPGNLKTAASSPCSFTANRHFSESKEPFHVKAISSLLRVHSYWKTTEAKNFVWDVCLMMGDKVFFPHTYSCRNDHAFKQPRFEMQGVSENFLLLQLPFSEWP